MKDFSGNTYANILKQMLNQIPDTIDKREGSMIFTAVGPAAYAFEEFYLALDNVQKSAFIQTAVGNALDYLAVIAGLKRYPASSAVRLGVFNTEVPIGARFSTINGADSINFIVTATADNGYQLTAETAGIIGNAYSGNILPITYINGLTEALMSDIIIPGDDAETDDELRTRLINALNEKPFGGNVAAYREFIPGLDGVGAVQVYPTWNGGGTVKCSIIGADLKPASEALIAAVQNAVDPEPNKGLGLGMAPIGAKVTVTTPTAVSINITATVTLAAGYQIGQVEPEIKEALSEYIMGICKNWGNPTVAGGIEYTANIYLAQVIAAIIGVTGVLNATGVKINGSAQDVILTETGQTQQLPQIGTVSINVAA